MEKFEDGRKGSGCSGPATLERTKLKTSTDMPLLFRHKVINKGHYIIVCIFK